MPLAMACGSSDDGSGTGTVGSGASGGAGPAGGAAGASAGAAGLGGTGATAGAGGAGQGGVAGACQRALPPKTGQDLCHTINDCPTKTGGFTCTAETPFEGCTGPLPPECASDAECIPAGTGGSGGSGLPVSVCQNYGSSKSCAPPCIDDMSCGPTLRCEQATGHCVPRPCDATKTCLNGTYCGAAGVCLSKECDPQQQDGCGAGRACDAATFSCVAKPCAATAECPEYFACTGGSCARQSCACDTECGTSGFCVLGKCDGSPGYCSGGVACGRPLVVEGALVVAGLARALAGGEGLWS